MRKQRKVKINVGREIMSEYNWKSVTNYKPKVEQRVVQTYSRDSKELADLLSAGYTVAIVTQVCSGVLEYIVEKELEE